MLGNVRKNWKTTLSGILLLITAVVGAINDPAALTQPEVIGQIVGGVGLIVAKDASKTGTVDAPRS